jgi:hypothetical protein
MKKLFLIALLATNCYAEPFRYDKPTVCDDAKEIFKMIDEYKEKVIFTGQPDGDGNIGSYIILTENAVTGTWTIIQNNSKFACVLAVGQNQKS